MQRFYHGRSGMDVQGSIADDDLWKMLHADISLLAVQVCCEGTEVWMAVSMPAAAVVDDFEEAPTLPSGALVAASGNAFIHAEAEGEDFRMRKKATRNRASGSARSWG